jgi:hydroxyacylglutathione hydrolase
MLIEPIPLLQDNYAWVIHDGRHAVIVDPSYNTPGEASPILAWLDARRIQATTILITHHHRDHTGGIGSIAAAHAVAVFGPPNSGITGITHPVGDGDQVRLDAPELDFMVLAIPGHTLDHLAYTLPGHLFCGDTLFSCGCGRVFEGTPAQMQRSLARLRDLPDTTQVYCAHEYTLENLAFARHIEPDQPHLHDWEQAAERLRDAHQPTLPVSLGDEKQRNPFLRWDDPAIQRIAREQGSATSHEPAEVFAAIRALKDLY